MRERGKGAAAGWSHPSVPPPLECSLASIRIQNTNNLVVMLLALNADCYTAEESGMGEKEEKNVQREEQRCFIYLLYM